MIPHVVLLVTDKLIREYFSPYSFYVKTMHSFYVKTMHIAKFKTMVLLNLKLFKPSNHGVI